MFTFLPLCAVQNMIYFIHQFNSCHFHHRVYYKLTMACSLVRLMDSRVLRPVIAEAGQGSIADQA